MYTEFENLYVIRVKFTKISEVIGKYLKYKKSKHKSKEKHYKKSRNLKNIQVVCIHFSIFFQ